jgi:hypothetical protein
MAKTATELLQEYRGIINEEDWLKDVIAKGDSINQQRIDNGDDQENNDLQLLIDALRDITLSCRKWAPTIDRSRAEEALRKVGQEL